MREDKQTLISAPSSPSTPDDEDDDCFEDEVSDSVNPYCDTTTTNSFPNDTQNHNHNNPRNSDSGQQMTIRLDCPNSGSDSNGRGTISSISINNFNNRRILSRKRSFSLYFGSVPTWTKRLGQIWRFHWRVLVSAMLTIVSAMGSIIIFPIYLKSMTNNSIESTLKNTDGYSACLAITTVSMLTMGLLGLILKGVHYSSGRTILRPLISWVSICKIGFCTGLCILTIFYAWEDHKVMCNLQDPLLGLVFVFAVITHAVSKWREMGYRRSFALVTIGAGVFISVDYTIVDHYKCRGYYYYPPIIPIKDPWSWQVHLVWTLAFVVCIWLWTVAMFCMESSLPHLKEKRHHVGEQYNAVKMKVIRVNRTGQVESAEDAENNQSLNPNENVVPTRIGLHAEPDLYQSPTIRQLRTVYSKISYLRVFNATLWFHISTWTIISSLFWTEFIPGFGKGISGANLPEVLWTGFTLCISGFCSWCLVIFVVIFSQAFAYLLLLIRSPLITIGVTCLAFPLVSIWWSFFQFNHNILIWTPMVSGELICGFLGIPLIMGGLYYLFKFDVLKLDYKMSSSLSITRPTQIV